MILTRFSTNQTLREKDNIVLHMRETLGKVAGCGLEFGEGEVLPLRLEIVQVSINEGQAANLLPHTAAKPFG